MKQLLESPESFTAYATISAGYYMIGEIQKEINKPIAPIVRAVDAACGYNRNKKHIDDIIICLEDIIEAKKVIDAPFDGDLELIEKLKNELPVTVK